jgi:hypothetical protein
MRKTIFFLICLLPAPNIFANDCHVVEYPDHNEIICEQPPTAPLPTPPPPRHKRISKKENDRFTPERKTAIRSLTKLMVQSETGISYRELSNLLADAKTDVNIYSNSTKNMGDEDAQLIEKMEKATLSFDICLTHWGLCISAHMICDNSSALRKGSDSVNEVIEFYNETWQ